MTDLSASDPERLNQAKGNEAVLKPSESELQFRLLVDTMPQLAWMANADGTTFWYNQRWYEYTKTTAAEMEGWGWQSVHDPAELPRVLERWVASINTGEPFEMEFPLRGGDGVFRWFLTRVTPVRDLQGKVTRWFGTNTDVTDIRLAREYLRESGAESAKRNEKLEKRMQEGTAQLRESDERFRILIENIRDHAILMLDPRGYIVSWNDSAERMKGYTAAEILGKHFSCFYPAEEVDGGLPERVLTAAAVNGHFEHEGLRVRKNGSQFWAKVMVTAMRDESGALLGFSKMTRDISANKLADEVLKRHTAKLKEQAALLELAHDAILVKAQNVSTILFWNAGAALLYGWSAEQAIGRRSHEILKTVFPQALATIEAEMQQCGHWEGELIHTKSDGSTITVASRWALQRDDRGEPVAVIEINRDITRQKKAESDLKDVHDRLRLALRGGRIGTWTWDVQKDVVSCDDQLAALFGLPSGTVTAELEYFASLVHPNDQEDVRAKLAAGLETGSFELEFRVPWPSGTVCVMLAHGETSYEAGKPVKMTGICWDITDRKAAENAMQASEARLKEAQRLAHVGSWEWAPATGKMVWSDELYRICGLDPGECITLARGLAVYPPERIAAIQADLERTLQTGEPYNSLERIVRKDGSTRYIERRGRIKHTGAETKLEGTVLDVTDLVTAQMALSESLEQLDRRVRERTQELAISNQSLAAKVQELERSEQRFESLVRATSEIIWTNNPNGQMKGVQAGWAAFTGQSMEEYQDHGWATAVHSDDVQPTIEAWELAVAERRPFAFEHRVRRHDGIYRLFSISAVPVMNDDGTIREWVGVHNDITERREQEEVIRKKEADFRFLAESVPQIVWTSRPDGWVDYYNERWRTYTGVAIKQAKGSGWGWEAVLDPDNWQDCSRVWNRSIASGEAYQVEYRFKRASDGAYRWHLGRAVPLRDETGAIVKWFGTFTDVHDYKEAEARNLCLRQELEDRVRLRTKDLERANGHLKTFSHQLEQSNRELQDFASVASHDLQEPLRKVQAFGDRLKTICAGTLPGRGDDYLNRMLNAVTRMQSLVQDLLTFSRVANPAPFVAVDLAAITREVLSDLEVRIAETGAMVEVGVLPTIQADPLQMRQLLQNLIGNALKFHKPDQPPRVRVRTENIDSSDQSANLLRLVVEDDGIGFDEKYLDRIFTVFQRLHGRDEYDGTGVGLAICRKIAHRHGGRITATSAPNQGAVFTVVLPLTQALPCSGPMDAPLALDDAAGGPSQV